MSNRQESAQTLALQALGWLAADDDRFGAFLAAGGMDADPMLHAAVMDFMLSDEAMLLQFCEDCGVKPEAPMQARMALPGGDAPFWT
jgi:Protein of unknown function (DUF3572)